MPPIAIIIMDTTYFYFPHVMNPFDLQWMKIARELQSIDIPLLGYDTS